MKILVSNWNNIYDDVIPKLVKNGYTLVRTPEEADFLLLWNEVGLSGRPLVEKAHKLGKKVITLQHGRYGSSRVYPPFNEHIISDKYLCWGEGDRNRLLAIGTNPDILEVVGSPILKYLKPRVAHEGKNIVFCPEHWGVEALENFIVTTELRKLKGVNIFSKLLEGEHDERFYQNPIISKRNSPGHIEKVMELLSKTDLVVSLLDGTFELIAESMDIPVILVDIWRPKTTAKDPRYIDYRRPTSPACLKIKDIKLLNKEIMYYLKHPEILREERKIVAIEDGGIDKGNPVENILKIINEMLL